MNMVTFSGPYELVAIAMTKKPPWIFSERARSVCGGHASPGRHAISFVSAFFSPIISLVFVWSHLREPLNMSMVPLSTVPPVLEFSSSFSEKWYS